MPSIRKFIDIGANLTDPMFNGIYNGSKKHQCDIAEVIERAWSNGVKNIIVTGGSLEDSKAALEIAKTDVRLFSTVGCHPTRCNEFQTSGDDNQYYENLKNLVAENRKKVVAVGECGLDFDRLEFCSRETQINYFEKQLELSKDLKLPLFLHCRNATLDLVRMLFGKNDTLYGGVVHSFDGTKDEASAILDLGYYIGINGCSLKTQQNLEAMASIPSDRLMIETDCPWCEVRPSHAGFKYIKTLFPSIKKEKWSADKMVKGRCEPSHINQIIEIMAAVREEEVESLCQILYENTEKLFFRRN